MCVKNKKKKNINRNGQSETENESKIRSVSVSVSAIVNNNNKRQNKSVQEREFGREVTIPWIAQKRLLQFLPYSAALMIAVASELLTRRCGLPAGLQEECNIFVQSAKIRC